MTKTSLSYALVTPARDELENLRRLAASIADQTMQASAWVIVDNGSTDGTLEYAQGLAREDARVQALAIEGSNAPVPGAPIVRAFNAGRAALDVEADVVVKLDADVSFERDYFEQLLDYFAADPALGIASGSCFELEGGSWKRTIVTGVHVRGAVRAYRSRCLEDVSPLREGMGWDGVDELRANALGWRTAEIADLPFYHHRPVGQRDGRRTSRWIAQGRGAYSMGYRFWYLALRAAYRAHRDPAALAMIWGYLRAAASGEPRYEDPVALAFLKREQSIRRLPVRIREALGKRTRS